MKKLVQWLTACKTYNWDLNPCLSCIQSHYVRGRLHSEVMVSEFGSRRFSLIINSKSNILSLGIRSYSPMKNMVHEWILRGKFDMLVTWSFYRSSTEQQLELSSVHRYSCVCKFSFLFFFLIILKVFLNGMLWNGCIDVHSFVRLADTHLYTCVCVCVCK